jgi:hypothetical protein
MWHRDFPPDASEMWQVIAKALLMRYPRPEVLIEVDELRSAADEQCEIELQDDGSIRFRKERN